MKFILGTWTYYFFDCALYNICYNKHKNWKITERVIKMKETINRIRKFRTDRDWDQFHTPANLSKAISIEAGELLEEFLWDEEDFNKEHVLEELADVMVYCIHMADSLGVNLEEIINSKMDKNEKKYPVEKAKGNSKKYTEL
ncbi:MazG nucleotide pyrophosphohydrolase domain protein [Clostridium sp. BL-8]|nr:MazG nucleotide pyrophosphohydrolase domain protein [Clostridium sp. BL-8]